MSQCGHTTIKGMLNFDSATDSLGTMHINKVGFSHVTLTHVTYCCLALRLLVGASYLCLLALSGKDTVIIIFCALIYKHLGHGNGTAREVWVVVQTFPHLHQWHTHQSHDDCRLGCLHIDEYITVPGVSCHTARRGQSHAQEYHEPGVGSCKLPYWRMQMLAAPHMLADNLLPVQMQPPGGMWSHKVCAPFLTQYTGNSPE